MKKAFLLISIFVFTLSACGGKGKSANSNTASGGVTTVNLTLSNFEKYVSYTKHQGYTGAAGYSPYKAWREFKGLLSIGVYDATVTYVVDDTAYHFKLDVSGGGKTDYFDRNASCTITKVSGTVSYRL